VENGCACALSDIACRLAYVGTGPLGLASDSKAEQCSGVGKVESKSVCEAKGESIAGEGGNTRFAFALGHLP